MADRDPFGLFPNSPGPLAAAAERPPVLRDAGDEGGTSGAAVMTRAVFVQNADKILVLEKGTVVETGTHSELLSKNGRYLDLWTLQRSEQAA